MHAKKDLWRQLNSFSWMFHWVCWKNNTLFRSLVFTGCMILSWVCHCSPPMVWLSGIEGAKRLFESNLSGFQSIVMFLVWLQVWYFHFSGGVGCAPWASVDSRCDGCGGCQHGLSSLGRRQLHPGWGSCWFDSCWGCGGVLVQNDSGCRMELLSPIHQGLQEALACWALVVGLKLGWYGH